MYCSLDKIDIIVDGQAVAMQTDHRACSDMEAELELSALFAMTRVLNARSHVATSSGSIVHYVVPAEVPPLVRDALAATGGLLERKGRRARSLGQTSEIAAGELADRCFAALARRAAARVGSRDMAIALRMLEDQTFAAAPERTDEAAYWTRVVELAALAGELLRAKWGGRWVQTDRALVPFGFQLADTHAVLFPTNRAQRVIEDGRDESLFKLLMAAEETMQRPLDVDAGRLMPSLRHRRDVDLDEVVWRPLLVDQQTPPDLPVVVCGVDGESTFGMIRREALGRTADEAHDEALANLAREEIHADRLEIGGIEIILVTGSFYAAEKVLDRRLMRQLHRELDSDLLAAATPTRGVLIVSAAHRDAAQLSRLVALVRNKYDDGGGRQISPAIVLLTDGKVAGYVKGPDRPDTEPARAETHRETPKKPGFLRRLFGRKP